jgi:hypothetical protein
MEYHKTDYRPKLTQTKDGWAAHGDGWAVHGATEEEATRKFQEAVAWHREIDERPFLFEKDSDAQSFDNQ